MTQPMRLSLIISADANGVSPATAETRKELATVTEAAQGTAAGLAAVSAANDRYEASARRASDAARGQSAAERDLRAAVMQFAGARSPLNDNALRARGADIDFYGAALDRLRARYNPLFAVVQNYKAVQAEIRQAHAVGAIGVDEMTAALGRERQAALASMAALKGRGSALHASSAGPGAFNTANIAAQFQDIGVTTAMGMSPLQIALQQGTQLSAVFEMMKANGQSAGSALLGAFTSIISPISLVTIGVIAGGAALAQYVMSASSVKSVDDILADHERNIALLGPAYERAAKGARQYITMSAEAVEAALKADKEASEKKVQELTSDVFGSIRKEMVKEAAAIGEAAGMIPSRFQPFRELIELLGEGGIKVTEFMERVSAIERADPRLGPVAAELRAFAKEANQAAFDLAGIEGSVDRVSLAFGKMQGEIDKINPHNASGRLADVEKKASELFTRARTGQIDVNGLTEELRSLAAVNPDLSQIIAQIGALGDAAIEARAKIGGSTPKGDRLSSMDALGETFDDVLQFQRRINPDLFDKIDPDKLKKTPRGRARSDPYRDLIKSADDRIKQLQQEIELTGRAGAEAEALRYEQELLSQATDKGRSIDEKQIAQIRAKAEEYGRLKAQLAATRLEQDLMFERDQLFRSPLEQRIAATMRSAGLEVDLSSTIADQIRWNEEIATTRELMMDIGSGIIADLGAALDDGKLEWEELGDIALNVLDKISARLIEMALDAAINGLLGSIFGGSLSNSGAGFNPSPTGFMDMLGLAKGGVLGSGNVIPFAKGGTFTNAIVDRPTLFSFANGSKFGGMGEAGPEAVMPLRRDASGRLGVLAGSNDNGGGLQRLHITVGGSIDRDGNLQTFVRDIAQSEGTKVAVTVVRENNQARENIYQNGGQG